MRIVASKWFWNKLHKLETNCFHIFAFITLVSKACYCAAHTSDFISNHKFAECNHLCTPSVATNDSLDCYLKTLSMHFHIVKSSFVIFVDLIGVPPLLTTWAHDISTCTCCPLVVFTIWTSGSSYPSTYCASFAHYSCWVSTTPIIPRPPSCIDKLSLWTSEQSW